MFDREAYFCSEGKSHYNYDTMVYYDFNNITNPIFTYPEVDKNIVQIKYIKEILLKHTDNISDELVLQIIEKLKEQKKTAFEEKVISILNDLTSSEEENKIE